MTTTWRLFILELRLFTRQPTALFFSLAFPVLLLFTFGFTYGHYEVGEGLRFIDIYVPELMATVIANLALMTMPVTYALYREQGVLKRWYVTPAPAWGVVISQLLVHLATFIVSSAIILGAASAVYRVRVTGNPALIALGFLLCVVVLFSMGLMLGGLCQSVQSVQAIGSSLFFVMLFSSGAALPRSEFPAWLQSATEYLPLTMIVDVMTGLWIGDAPSGMVLRLALLSALGFGMSLLGARAVRLSYQP